MPEEVRRARTTGATFHLTSQVVKANLPEGGKDIGDQEPQGEMKEVSPEGWMKSRMYQNKVKRLERAKHQRDRLMRELEEVWSFLEDGMPGQELDLESNTMEEGRSTSKKRKRAESREDEIRRLEDEMKQDRLSVDELRMEIKEEDVTKDSLKIPAVKVEKSPIKDIYLTV